MSFDLSPVTILVMILISSYKCYLDGLRGNLSSQRMVKNKPCGSHKTYCILYGKQSIKSDYQVLIWLFLFLLAWTKTKSVLLEESSLCLVIHKQRTETCARTKFVQRPSRWKYRVVFFHMCTAPCGISSGVSGQLRSRSAWASAQSDQGLRCPLT